MGTYTTNKNLFMPTVGEQGWGTLVNGNFETIDNFLKPISLSGSTYTFTGNHVGNQSGGSISATSISNSGTLTSTGKITANGGIGTTSLTTSSTITSTGKITGNGGIAGTTGTFSGAVSATDFNRTTVHTVSSGAPRTTAYSNNIPGESALIFVLPNTDANYTGTITLRNLFPSTNKTIYYRLGTNGNITSITINANSTTNISLTNVDSVYIWGPSTGSNSVTIGKITLS